MLQYIFKGAVANDETGTPARTAAQIINDNFDYLDRKITRKDGIVESTGYSGTPEDKIMNAYWEWIIDTIDYTNPAPVTLSFPLAASGKMRLDVIALTTSNAPVRIPGPESDSKPVSAPLPDNMIQAGIVLVTDSTVGEPTPPILGTAYVQKIESQDFIFDSDATTVIDQIDLVDDRSSISLIGSATDVKSVQVSDLYIRPGKPHFFKNRTDHNVKIWHLAGTGNVKYFFPDGFDLIVKPNEVIQFNTNTNDYANVRFEYVGKSDLPYSDFDLKSYSSNKKIVPTAKKAVFSFIWDDLQDSDQLVYNIFQEYGYVPNYAIVTGVVNDSTIASYIKFYQEGCSILAHSVTHPNMSGTTLTNAQVNAEMIGSQNFLESYGIRVSGWVTPMSDLNPIYYPQIDKNFGYGFVFPSNTGAHNQTVNPLRMSRVSLEEAMYGHNLANVKAIIDDAITNNKLITFYAHHLPSTYLNVDSTPSLTEADLRDILAYLKTKTDENLCEVLSTDEAVKNYYDNSIITQDGTVVNVGGKLRVFGSENNPYSPAFSTPQIGNIASVNNNFNADNTSSLVVFSANRSSGVSASIYAGVINNNIDHQSIFVLGRKIDATNWEEIMRILSTSVIFPLVVESKGLVVKDPAGGVSIKINRGTGGVQFGNVLDADDLILYNKAGTIVYQRWNPDGTILLPSLAGSNNRQVLTDSTGKLFALPIDIYASDAAADAALPSGAFYKITGNRTIFQKP